MFSFYSRCVLLRLIVNELCTVESLLYPWAVSAFDFYPLAALDVYARINFELFCDYGEDEQLPS